MTVPVISFVGPSGTGKTTLLESVVAALSDKGHRVATIKHDAHRIELDTEGKDSWRLRRAGSSETLLVGRNQILWMGTDDVDIDLDALIALFCSTADIVLVEGYRSAGLETIRVERPEVDDRRWHEPDPDRVIATVHPGDVSPVVELLTARLDPDTSGRPGTPP